MMFRTWTRDEIVTAIKDLEMNLAGGIASISNSAQGSISYSSPVEGRRTLRALYLRLDAIDGLKASSTRPRIWSMGAAGREI